MDFRRPSSTRSALPLDGTKEDFRTGHRSELVALFLDRCAIPGASPFDAMEQCVEGLRTQVGISSKGTLDAHCEARQVRRRVLVDDLDSDGAIRPLGSGVSDGFVVELNARLPALRRRFTEAHELCHTFFYQLVPEIKFRPHERDPFEEALCNHGASSLLIPGESLRLRVVSRAASLATLEELSREYGVALGTMCLRLRHLVLWDCHLSIWHRAISGGFLPLQVYGWRKAEWRWVNEEVLEEAWSRPGVREGRSGRTFVWCEDQSGLSYARPIHYELRRRGNVITVLSSDRPFQQQREINLPLFARRQRAS